MLNNDQASFILRRLKNSICFIALLSFLSLSSCVKDEGVGGTATITGTVIAKELSNSGVLLDQYFAAEERVYIVYGNNEIHDDDARTHYTGSYQFEFLRKGTYTIYAYSNCDTCPGGVEPIEVTVEVGSRGEDVVAPDIVIIK